MTRKSISQALLLTSLILLTVWAFPVMAADAVVGTGSAGSCTEAAFDTALATVMVGGGTVTFNCGGPATINITSQKIIDAQSATVTIDGGGNITIDGGSSTRIFRVANGRSMNFTLRGITLQNGRAQGYPDSGDDSSQGGAILFGYGNDTLRIENSSFLNNVAVTNGNTWDGGGAIHIRIGKLFISDSLFEGNSAPNGGAMNILITSGTVSNTVFRGNSATTTIGGGGGAIYIDNGMLTFDRILVENNTSTRLAAGYMNNGGSANIGPETISNSTFRNNTVIGDGSGAGVYNYDDAITIINTTINNNTAPSHGAGLWHHSASTASFTATIINSTISGNIATSGNGAGVVSAGPAQMTITNSLIANNYTGVQGSAIRGAEGPVVLQNTIIYNNSSAHEWVNEQCYGNIVNGGNNIQWPTVNQDGRSAICSAEFASADPRIGPLQDNGGPTFTHALLSGSPALDAGSCVVQTDQRGVTRPSTGCDVGPYEAGDELPSLAPPANIVVDPGQGRPMLTWTNDEAEWYAVWMGRSDYTQTLLYQWFQKNGSTGANDIQCAGLTCTFAPNVNPVSGNYEFWISSYSEALGLSKGGTGGWAGPASFSLPNTPAGFPSGFSVENTASSKPTFNWIGSSNATWYQVWIGTGSPSWRTRHFNWYLGSDIGCTSPGETCSISPSDINLSSGDYVWYVQVWGPGGIGSNSLGGWVDAGGFTVTP